MSKQNEQAIRSKLWNEQKISKPKIDDVISEYLNGETKKAALEFSQYMFENKMTLRWAGVTNAWKAIYKNKCICYVRLESPNWNFEENGTSWFVAPNLEQISKYERLIIAEGLQDLIWNNLYHCRNCFPDRDCARQGGIIRTILGREIKGLCIGRTPFWFCDPDKAAIDCIKRLLELEQKARTENKTTDGK
jgi:hypothetical protein